MCGKASDMAREIAAAPPVIVYEDAVMSAAVLWIWYHRPMNASSPAVEVDDPPNVYPDRGVDPEMSSCFHKTSSRSIASSGTARAGAAMFCADPFSWSVAVVGTMLARRNAVIRAVVSALATPPVK